mmetsp:Transcript_10286/g.32758  ORF Transcript_10286/g.32758 Transcript_10286/m.32758 type:complete len:254 (-) Transcript_10286:190-951(-)
MRPAEQCDAFFISAERLFEIPVLLQHGPVVENGLRRCYLELNHLVVHSTRPVQSSKGLFKICVQHPQARGLGGQPTELCHWLAWRGAVHTNPRPRRTGDELLDKRQGFGKALLAKLKLNRCAVYRHQAIDMLEGLVGRGAQNGLGLVRAAVFFVDPRELDPERIRLADCEGRVDALDGILVRNDCLRKVATFLEKSGPRVPLIAIMRILAQHDGIQKEGALFDEVFQLREAKVDVVDAVFRLRIHLVERNRAL